MIDPPVLAPAKASPPEPTGSVDQARLLLELTREVTGSRDLQQVLEASFRALRKLVRFGGGAIQLIEGDALVAVATDPVLSEEAKGIRIPVGQGVSGTIAATGEPIYIPDISQDPRVHPEGRRCGVSSGVRSYFGVPLIMHGVPVGVLQIDAPRPNAFPPGARASVMMLVPTIAAAVQNAQLFDRDRETLQQLHETERLQRDFLAVVSHELRTPLTSVAGFGYTLAQHAHVLDPETVADIGQRIWRASRRLERVMGDLLDLSQIERDVLGADLLPTDIEPVVREAAREQTTDEHPIRVEIEPGLPRALIDADRLHQIAGNLLSNARKFSPAGSTIDVSARRSADRISLSVADEGRGIPPDMLERVFERFFQVEPAATRSADGLGIGLYLVKQLCERMNIAIRVSSEPGRGTTITTDIPIAS